jgi:hypothetical protein
MSYETLRTTIHSYFDTQWGTTTPVAWPGTTYKPVPFNAFQADLAAAPKYRRTGAIAIDVFTPRNQGGNRNDELCDLLVADFLGQQSGVVNFWGLDGTVPDVVPGTDTTWFHQQVRVPFWWEGTT